jgi:hypothetical protein
MCEVVYEAAKTATGWSFESAITLVLAALGALIGVLAAILTALAIGIGIAAIWGWSGIKEAAAKAATDAMNLKMREYPGPEVMLELASRMEEILGSWDAIQNKLVTGAATNQLAPASNAGVQQETTVAPPYPGEGVQNVSSAPANPEPHNPGPDAANPG